MLLLLMSLICHAESAEHAVKRAAIESNVSPELLWAIALVESSGCKFLYNSKTKDYGCLQINKVNLKGHDLHLITNSPYHSAKIGAKILYKLKKYQVSEPLTWFCRYNVGNRPDKKAKACLKYVNKVSNKLKQISSIAVN